MNKSPLRLLNELHLLEVESQEKAAQAKAVKYIDSWDYQVNQMVSIGWNLNEKNRKEVTEMIERFNSLIRIAAGNLETNSFDIK